MIKRSKLTILVSILFICFCLTAPVSKAADIAINFRTRWERGRCWDPLIELLTSDGHDVTHEDDSFLNPFDYDVFFYHPVGAEISDEQIESIINFTFEGGHFILCGGVGNSRYRIEQVELANEILSYPDWYDDLGRPQFNYELIQDSLPDTISGLAGGCEAFLLDFHGFDRANDIDTIFMVIGHSISLLSTGNLSIAGTGNHTSFGVPFSIYDAVYDSFAVGILNGHFGNGEITIFCDFYTFCYTSLIREVLILDFYDNRQFARQLFQTNNRADSVVLSQDSDNLSMFDINIFGDFDAYMSDSVLLFFEYSDFDFTRYGYQHHITGDGYNPHLDFINAPLNPEQEDDSLLVCVKLLPDSTGETILPKGEVCINIWQEFIPDSVFITECTEEVNSFILEFKHGGIHFDPVNVQYALTFNR